MLINVLYVILVLSFVALAWAGLAMYLRVRRHMKETRTEAHENIPKHL